MGEQLTVVTMVLPEESVVVRTPPAPPPEVLLEEVLFPPDMLPPDMVELLELPLAPLVELVLPPIAPPVGDDPSVIVVYVEPAVSVVVMTPAAPPEPEPELLDAPAVMTEVPTVRVPETDRVEPGLALTAATAPIEVVRLVVIREESKWTHCCRNHCRP